MSNQDPVAVYYDEGTGRILRVVYDLHPENPRDMFDTLGKIACWSRHYDIGDPDHIIRMDPGEYEDEYAFMAAVKEKYPEIAVILPLYLYDHSGIILSTTTGSFRAADSARWDWGWVGLIYMTADTLKKNGFDVPTAEEALRLEVQEYNDYIAGCVYSYDCVKVRPTPEQLDRYGIQSLRELDEYALSRIVDTIIYIGGDFDACCGFYGDIDGVLDRILEDTGFTADMRVY